MPPLSTTPSAPSSTRSTRSITKAAAESTITSQGMPCSPRSASATRRPESSGQPSHTTHRKCLPAAAAAPSSCITQREYPCSMTIAPSLTKRSPSSAIRRRAFVLSSANFSPLSIRPLLMRSRSTSAEEPCCCCFVAAVTFAKLLMKSSKPALREITTRGLAFLSASAPSRSSTSRPITVVTCDLLMIDVRQLIAFVAYGSWSAAERLTPFPRSPPPEGGRPEEMVLMAEAKCGSVLVGASCRPARSWPRQRGASCWRVPRRPSKPTLRPAHPRRRKASARPAII
mmetsp:Transcript_3261/g.11826  ORF Transcript_3261/g.11826 Transcript_3261/m.11826 type:complete len:285 (+) Transcript_3261:1758-2612(+)